MAVKQILYADFSQGVNDTIAAISIADNEVAKSENAVYSDEVKGIKTRKGCTKINTTSYGMEVTDGVAWAVGSAYKVAIVRDGKLYDMNVADGSAVEKLTLTSGATLIYPFQLYDRLYFGDGTKLYSWGDFDFTSELGTKDLAVGTIVRNNTSSSGTIGNFYRSKVARIGVNLTNEDYTNTGNWENVTDVRYASSNVVREVMPYDPATKETVLISITRGAAAAGTVSVILNNETFAFTTTATDTVPQVVDKLYAMASSGWSKVKTSNGVKFTKDSAGLSENGYVDPGVTGIGVTYETVVEGKTNDNDLAPIRKCTMFWVHTGSFRVFAAGNPEDNGLFYSEVGNPAYFKSALNKVYPVSGYGKVKALNQLSESLLVSYENGWYAWNGVTPLEDATWKPLNLPYGCASNDSLALTPSSFTFLGNDGIYNVHASILSSDLYLIQSRETIRKITDAQVDKAINSIADKSKCRGVFHENSYYLAYNTDGIKNDHVIEYEWDTKSFTFRTGWQVNCWIPSSQNLYFGSKNYLLEANDGYHDIDVETGEPKPVELDVLTKEYALGNPFSQKNLMFLGLIFKQNSEDTSNVNVKLHMGYESVDVDFGTGPIDLAESLIWGREWGKVWGYRESILKMIEVGRASNTFQVEIKDSNIDDPITLIAIGFIYEESDLVLPTIMKDEVLLT